MRAAVLHSLLILARIRRNANQGRGKATAGTDGDVGATTPDLPGSFLLNHWALQFADVRIGMPKIHRTMFEQDGKPRVGTGWCELGVRPPGRMKPNGQPALADVDLDANGNVLMNKKGMSVFRSLEDLPALHSRLVPIHLATRIRGAAGPSGARIWTMGQGPFVSGPLTSALDLHEAGTEHGNVCPSTTMPLAALQSELAQTQDSWTIEEPSEA